eukprot:Hpha_TRINITY_DN57_c0_g1::TRINITY_DN57_c0_g1_i1::g.110111::m.110111
MSFRTLFRMARPSTDEEPRLAGRTHRALVESLEFSDLQKIASGLSDPATIAAGECPAVRTLLKDCGYGGRVTCGDVSALADQMRRIAEKDCMKAGRGPTGEEEGNESEEEQVSGVLGTNPHWTIAPALRDAMASSCPGAGYRGLKPSRIVSGGSRAARCVFRIDTPRGGGSGVLVAPRLLLTSSSLIASPKQALEAEVTALKDARCAPVRMRLIPSEAFSVAAVAGQSFRFALEKVTRSDALILQIQPVTRTAVRVGAVVRINNPGKPTHGMRGCVRGIIGRQVIVSLPPPHGLCPLDAEQLANVTVAAESAPTARCLGGRTLPHGSLVSLSECDYTLFEVVGDEDPQMRLVLRTVSGIPHHFTSPEGTPHGGWGVVHRLGRASGWCVVAVQPAEGQELDRSQREQLRKMKERPVRLAERGQRDAVRRQLLSVITHNPERTCEIDKRICVGVARVVACGPGRLLEVAAEGALPSHTLPGLSDGAPVFDIRWRLLGTAGPAGCDSRSRAECFQCISCLAELQEQGMLTPQAKNQIGEGDGDSAKAEVRTAPRDHSLPLRQPKQLVWCEANPVWLRANSAANPVVDLASLQHGSFQLPAFGIDAIDTEGRRLSRYAGQVTCHLRVESQEAACSGVAYSCTPDRQVAEKGRATFRGVTISPIPSGLFRLVVHAEYVPSNPPPYPLSRSHLVKRIPPSAKGPVVSAPLRVTCRPGKTLLSSASASWGYNTPETGEGSGEADGLELDEVDFED